MKKKVIVGTFSLLTSFLFQVLYLLMKWMLRTMKMSLILLINGSIEQDGAA